MNQVISMLINHPALTHGAAFLSGLSIGPKFWSYFIENVLPSLVLKGIAWLKAHGMTKDEEKILADAIHKVDETVENDVSASNAKQG